MIFAIDFGTSNSLISFINDKNLPEIIVNERGSRITPSVVSFKNSKEVYVGEIAKNQAILEPESTIVNIKRQFGKDFLFVYKKREYKATEIGSLVFRKLKQIAKERINKIVKNVVVTVPAYFNNNQREDIIHAASIAGLNVIALLNEPTAAALAYQLENDKTVMVIDIGGGTVDISFIKVENNSYKVIGVSGNTNIGGVDYDKVLANYFIEKFKKEKSIDLSEDKIAYQQLIIQSERVKIDVSSNGEGSLMLPYIGYSSNGPVHIKEKITKELFNEITKEITEKILKIIKDSFHINDILPENIDIVIFSGGGSKIYPLQDRIKDFFKNVKKDIKFLYSINPEEVVCIGAAYFAGILEKRIKEIKFINVTSHSLGLLDEEQNYVEIIPKNTPYPVSVDKYFTTVEDQQQEVYIPVCQKDVNNNLIHLDTFVLTNLRKAKAGDVTIVVTFKINKNGMLNVSGVDIDTLAHTEIIIKSPFIKRSNKEKERRGKGLKIL